jgi:hypothetical protein
MTQAIAPVQLITSSRQHLAMSVLRSSSVGSEVLSSPTCNQFGCMWATRHKWQGRCARVWGRESGRERDTIDPSRWCTQAATWACMLTILPWRLQWHWSSTDHPKAEQDSAPHHLVLSPCCLGGHSQRPCAPHMV